MSAFSASVNEMEALRAEVTALRAQTLTAQREKWALEYAIELDSKKGSRNSTNAQDGTETLEEEDENGVQMDGRRKKNKKREISHKREMKEVIAQLVHVHEEEKQALRKLYHDQLTAFQERQKDSMVQGDIAIKNIEETLERAENALKASSSSLETLTQTFHQVVGKRKQASRASGQDKDVDHVLPSPEMLYLQSENAYLRSYLMQKEVQWEKQAAEVAFVYRTSVHSLQHSLQVLESQKYGSSPAGISSPNEELVRKDAEIEALRQHVQDLERDLESAKLAHALAGEQMLDMETEWEQERKDMEDRMGDLRESLETAVQAESDVYELRQQLAEAAGTLHQLIDRAEVEKQRHKDRDGADAKKPNAKIAKQQVKKNSAGHNGENADGLHAELLSAAPSDVSQRRLEVAEQELSKLRKELAVQKEKVQVLSSTLSHSDTVASNHQLTRTASLGDVRQSVRSRLLKRAAGRSDGLIEPNQRTRSVSRAQVRDRSSDRRASVGSIGTSSTLHGAADRSVNVTLNSVDSAIIPSFYITADLTSQLKDASMSRVSDETARATGTSRGPVLRPALTYRGRGDSGVEWMDPLDGDEEYNIDGEDEDDFASVQSTPTTWAQVIAQASSESGFHALPPTSLPASTKGATTASSKIPSFTPSTAAYHSQKLRGTVRWPRRLAAAGTLAIIFTRQFMRHTHESTLKVAFFRWKLHTLAWRLSKAKEALLRGGILPPEDRTRVQELEYRVKEEERYRIRLEQECDEIKDRLQSVLVEKHTLEDALKKAEGDIVHLREELLHVSNELLRTREENAELGATMRGMQEEGLQLIQALGDTELGRREAAMEVNRLRQAEELLRIQDGEKDTMEQELYALRAKQDEYNREVAFFSMFAEVTGQVRRGREVQIDVVNAEKTVITRAPSNGNGNGNGLAESKKSSGKFGGRNVIEILKKDVPQRAQSLYEDVVVIIRAMQAYQLQEEELLSELKDLQTKTKQMSKTYREEIATKDDEVLQLRETVLSLEQELVQMQETIAEQAASLAESASAQSFSREKAFASADSETPMYPGTIGAPVDFTEHRMVALTTRPAPAPTPMESSLTASSINDVMINMDSITMRLREKLSNIDFGTTDARASPEPVGRVNMKYSSSPTSPFSTAIIKNSPTRIVFDDSLTTASKPNRPLSPEPEPSRVSLPPVAVHSPVIPPSVPTRPVSRSLSPSLTKDSGHSLVEPVQAMQPPPKASPVSGLELKKSNPPPIPAQTQNEKESYLLAAPTRPPPLPSQA